MSTFSQTILMGRLGSDPQVIEVGSTNKKKATFSIATNEFYKDKNGDKKEITDWHEVVAWGAKAEIAERFLKKGKSVLVLAKHKTDVWEKDGQKGRRDYFLADKIVLVDGNFADSNEAKNQEQEKDTDDLPF